MIVNPCPEFCCESSANNEDNGGGGGGGGIRRCQRKPSPIRVKDVSDRKILHTEFFQSSVHYYSSYWLSRKSMKKFAVTDEKYSVSIRLPTVKNNSHADMHTQLLEKGFQHGEEDSKSKILS